MNIKILEGNKLYMAHSPPRKQHPTAAELELLLLEETTEDWKGLWEICGALKEAFVLKGSDAEIGAMAAPTIRTLLHQGLIKFARKQWVGSEFSTVPSRLVESLLTNGLNWSVPPTDDYLSVWCVATDEGERALSLLLKKLK